MVGLPVAATVAHKRAGGGLRPGRSRTSSSDAVEESASPPCLAVTKAASGAPRCLAAAFKRRRPPADARSRLEVRDARCRRPMAVLIDDSRLLHDSQHYPGSPFPLGPYPMHTAPAVIAERLMKMRRRRHVRGDEDPQCSFSSLGPESWNLGCVAAAGRYARGRMLTTKAVGTTHICT
ncbi:hypothetical protein EJ02DRAFT_463465 [Clathrospora elynae]|uniref:Uncharacterized protein n=1 Tax=Clathrospora elynae TaxID=706981 RepID=A0A6A5T132_9PLEO|nr:hypothetical protein EJ02DRAFT_463465 [Clathrospora elynae]